jgi:hypothetical protein
MPDHQASVTARATNTLLKTDPSAPDQNHHEHRVRLVIPLWHQQMPKPAVTLGGGRGGVKGVSAGSEVRESTDWYSSRLFVLLKRG